MSHRSWIASGGNEADAFAEDDRKREKRLRDQERAGAVERLCGDYEPPWCSIYDKECPHNGEECEHGCVFEERSAQDSDEATDRGDHECHRGRDQ